MVSTSRLKRGHSGLQGFIHKRDPITIFLVSHVQNNRVKQSSQCQPTLVGPGRLDFVQTGFNGTTRVLDRLQVETYLPTLSTQVGREEHPRRRPRQAGHPIRLANATYISIVSQIIKRLQRHPSPPTSSTGTLPSRSKNARLHARPRPCTGKITGSFPSQYDKTIGVLFDEAMCSLDSSNREGDPEPDGRHHRISAGHHCARRSNPGRQEWDRSGERTVG